MKKYIKRSLTKILITATAMMMPITAFAAEPACDFNGVVEWFTDGKGANIAFKLIGLLFIIALTIFGFLKKSMPTAVKDLVMKLLGNTPAKP